MPSRRDFALGLGSALIAGPAFPQVTDPLPDAAPAGS